MPLPFLPLLDLIGLSIHVAGELLVGATAISVHHRFKQEHKIDEAVFKIMQKEQVFGMIGLGLIVVGWSLELYARYMLHV